jgi:hypothetical protein
MLTKPYKMYAPQTKSMQVGICFETKKHNEKTKYNT